MSSNLCFNLSQFLSGNQANNLTGILRKLTKSNNKLFRTKCATLVNLFSKRTQYKSISTVVSNAIVVSRVLSNLLVSRLPLPELHDSPRSPSRIGGELLLHIFNHFRIQFHRGNSLQASREKSSGKNKKTNRKLIRQLLQKYVYNLLFTKYSNFSHL